MDAAGSLFSERGYARTTMRDIGRCAGITDAAIYYHFHTKRDLLEKLLAVELRVGSCRDGSLVGRGASIAMLIERVVDRAIESVKSRECLLRIVVREAMAGDVPARRRYRDFMDAWEKDVASAIRTNGGRRPPAEECESLAREIVATTAMAIEDTLFFRRDAAVSPAERWRNLRRFLVRELTTLADCAGYSPGGRRVLEKAAR